MVYFVLLSLKKSNAGFRLVVYLVVCSRFFFLLLLVKTRTDRTFLLAPVEVTMVTITKCQLATSVAPAAISNCYQFVV